MCTIHANHSWVFPLVGGVLGAAAGWVESSQLPPTRLSARVGEVRLDAERVRRDDYHLIGGVVGGLLLPALFRT